MDYKKALFIVVFFFLSACEAIASPTGKNTLTTSKPSGIPLATRTPSPISTATPLPTLTYEDKLAVTKDLLTTNAGCKLPCWWGFTPGETKWEDAKRYLETFATIFHYIERNDDIKVEVGFLVPEEFSPSAEEFPGPRGIYNDYFIEDEVIVAIEIDVGLAHTYDLSNLLKEYGQPDEVYIDTDPERFQGSLQTTLVLLYKSQGIFAYYEVPGTEMGDEIQACFENENVSRMMVWSPEIEWSYIEATEKTQFLPPIREFLFLEEVTDMDEEMFYQTYQDTTSSICINVLREPFYYYDMRPTPKPPTCVYPGESPN